EGPPVGRDPLPCFLQKALGAAEWELVLEVIPSHQEFRKLSRTIWGSRHRLALEQRGQVGRIEISLVQISVHQGGEDKLVLGIVGMPAQKRFAFGDPFIASGCLCSLLRLLLQLPPSLHRHRGWSLAPR